MQVTHDVDICCSAHEANPNHDGTVDVKTGHEEILSIREEIQPVEELQRRQNPYMLRFYLKKRKGRSAKENTNLVADA